METLLQTAARALTGADGLGKQRTEEWLDEK